MPTPKPMHTVSKRRCDFASQANAQMGPCTVDPCTCCADRVGHSFGTASHSIRDYFTRPGAIKRRKATPVRADRSLYLCPAHAKAWLDLYPLGRPVLELSP